MVCKYCGKDQGGITTKFCRFCGKQLFYESPIQNVQANHSQNIADDNNQASNIKNAELKSTTSNYEKLYSELTFYKQLVEEGLIDEDDYNFVKKKLLNI